MSATHTAAHTHTHTLVPCCNEAVYIHGDFDRYTREQSRVRLHLAAARWHASSSTCVPACR